MGFFSQMFTRKLITTKTVGKSDSYVPRNMNSEKDEIDKAIDKAVEDLKSASAHLDNATTNMSKEMEKIFADAKLDEESIVGDVFSAEKERQTVDAKIATLEAKLAAAEAQLASGVHELAKLSNDNKQLQDVINKQAADLKAIKEGNSKGWKYHFLYYYDGTSYAVGPFDSVMESKLYGRAFMKHADDDHAFFGTAVLIDSHDDLEEEAP